MHSISKDMRRATRDMDLDFIKYSLEDNSIIRFIEELSNVDDGIKIKIDGEIKELHHQDYDGKRVNIELFDKNKDYDDIGLVSYIIKEIDDLYCKQNQSVMSIENIKRSIKQFDEQMQNNEIRNWI